MMTDPGTTDVTGGGVPQIKKELDSNFQECSPSNSDMYSPSTTVIHDVGVSTYLRLYLQKIQVRNNTHVLRLLAHIHSFVLVVCTFMSSDADSTN